MKKVSYKYIKNYLFFRFRHAQKNKTGEKKGGIFYFFLGALMTKTPSELKLEVI